MQIYLYLFKIPCIDGHKCKKYGAFERKSPPRFSNDNLTLGKVSIQLVSLDSG